MGQQLHPPLPVKLIMPMLSASEQLLSNIEDDLQQRWGAIDIRSGPMPFEHTHYYDREMGAPLWRKLVSFAPLIEADQLAQVKHQSNALETTYAQVQAGSEHGSSDTIGADRDQAPARTINLDPGYLTQSKLVLATTKDYSHRVYIGDSMYAEATLHYHQGAWRTWPYTYRDYASGQYDEFLNRARGRLIEQLSQRQQHPDK